MAPDQPPPGAPPAGPTPAPAAWGNLRAAVVGLLFTGCIAAAGVLGPVLLVWVLVLDGLETLVER